MKLIEGGGTSTIAGAKVGDTIMVYLTTNKVEKLLLSKVTKIGIEGFELSLKERPLAFYPFTDIIKIKKHNQLE